MAKTLFLALLLATRLAWAAEAQPAVADPALEARVMSLASELRCLVCQNQTVADSHADLAQDLRREIRTQLAQGKSEREIVDYMTARYGDFVLYRPPFKATTAVLWIGPAALLAIAIASLVIVLRRRTALADSAFEPETPDTDEPH
jgi:cytochrome c-type biogenesis protein CcmH